MIKDIRVLEASSGQAAQPTWCRALRAETVHTPGATGSNTVLRQTFGKNLKPMGQECVAPRIGTISGIRKLWVSDSFLTPSVNNVFQVINLQRTYSITTGTTGINSLHPLRLVEFDGIEFNAVCSWSSEDSEGGVSYNINLTVKLGRQGSLVSSNATALQLLANTAVSVLFQSQQGILYFVGGTTHRLSTSFTATTATEAGEESGYVVNLTTKSPTPVLVALPLLIARPQFNVPVPGSLFGNIISVQTACTLPLGARNLTTESALPFPTNPAACSITQYARP